MVNKIIFKIINKNAIKLKINFIESSIYKTKKEIRNEFGLNGSDNINDD